MVRYANDLICIFMNTYENMRKREKMLDKKQGGYVHITYISAANYSRLPKLVSNERCDIVL